MKNLIVINTGVINTSVISSFFLFLNLSCMDMPRPKNPVLSDEKRPYVFYEDEKDPKFSKIKYILEQSYEYVVENIDILISRRGPKKAIEILTPFLAIYSHYFGDSQIQVIINKLTRSIGKAQGMHEIQLSIGKSDAFWESMSSDPLGVTTMYLAKLADKLLSCECECGCLPCM